MSTLYSYIQQKFLQAIEQIVLFMFLSGSMREYGDNYKSVMECNKGIFKSMKTSSFIKVRIPDSMYTLPFLV